MKEKIHTCVTYSKRTSLLQWRRFPWDESPLWHGKGGNICSNYRQDSRQALRHHQQESSQPSIYTSIWGFLWGIYNDETLLLKPCSVTYPCCNLLPTWYATPGQLCFKGNRSPNEATVKTMDRVLSYVVWIMGVDLTYGGPNTDLILKGCSDASFVANVKNEDQCSSYRWISVYGRCAISL